MNSLQKDLANQFCDGIDALVKELSLYESESSIWLFHEFAKNSAGHLSLHLIGNLNHFIGHMIGGTDYVRNRENEFGGEPVSREAIIEALAQTKHIVNSAFNTISNERLAEEFPVQVFGFPMTHQYLLFRLLGHFNYHLGQVNYHRRLLN